MKAGIGNRIMEICMQKEYPVQNLEEKLKLPSGTIRSWNTKSPFIFDFLNVCQELKQHPYYIYSGQKLNKLERNEEELIFIYRQLDGRGRRVIHSLLINEIIEMIQYNSDEGDEQ